MGQGTAGHGLSDYMVMHLERGDTRLTRVRHPFTGKWTRTGTGSRQSGRLLHDERIGV